MAEDKSGRGRPGKGDEDGRLRLLEAAKDCFTRLPFEQVTTRMLAQQAGVNAALIRYYFINKDGLYRQMFVDVTDEVMTNLQQELSEPREFEMESLFLAFNRVMAKTPQFPLLMIKELILGQGRCREFLLDRMRRTHLRFFMSVLQSFKQQGLLKEDIDIRLLQINFMSMLLFPWHFRSLLHELPELDADADFFTRLAKHNAKVLQHGCFKSNE